VLAHLEGAVRDALEQLGVMLQGADVAPSHIVRRAAEVIVAELLEPSKYGVDLGLLGDESG
jgi:hypothetical protein